MKIEGETTGYRYPFFCCQSELKFSTCFHRSELLCRVRISVHIFESLKITQSASLAGGGTMKKRGTLRYMPPYASLHEKERAWPWSSSEWSSAAEVVFSAESARIFLSNDDQARRL